MMGWFTKKTDPDAEARRIFLDSMKEYKRIAPPEKKKARFVEFEGAIAKVDEETGKIEFLPRAPISINMDKIGAYYDHTILIFGNKIRVMETFAQIHVKLKEAEG